MPRYETKKTLAAETKLKELVERRFNRHLVKMPEKYCLDYSSVDTDGIVRGFIELKCCNNNYLKYPRYLLDVHKVSAAKQLSDVTGLPCTLIVQWHDAIGYVIIPPKNFFIAVKNRTKEKTRNDPNDLQPFFMIPIRDFEIIHRY